MEDELGNAREQEIDDVNVVVEQPVEDPIEQASEQPKPATENQLPESKDFAKREIFGKRKAEPNTIFVGNKPPMNYVLAVVTQFNSGTPDVRIKARGRAISRAVDVAEIVRNKFLIDVTVASIDIGTEALENESGGSVNVSTVDIKLHR